MQDIEVSAEVAFQAKDVPLETSENNVTDLVNDNQDAHEQVVELHAQGAEPEAKVEVDTEADAEAAVEPKKQEKRTPLPIQTTSYSVDERSSESEPGTPLPNPVQTTIPLDKNMSEFITPPTPGIPPTFDPKYREELQAVEAVSNTNTFAPMNINLKEVRANMLTPRQQERQDEDMRLGMTAFFENRFTTAKTLFEKRANEDPLYSLGLGCMAFIRAVTSMEPRDTEIALESLTGTYQFAHAQVDAASAKKPLKDTVSHYITNLMGNNPTGLPTNTRPLNQEELREQPTFIPNGALRAHVIKAECRLLMAILHLLQETVVGYLKAGLNLRRAYSSYSLVWQEYKRMGQDFNNYMDADTISAVQFGIGSVHLLLSSLPPKVLKIVSAFGWNADKHLGFALLKLCLEGKRIRSPLASMMLLTYYIVLTSSAPLVLNRELLQPAVECLLDAQQSYPQSAFFLYFAGRVSRLTRSLELSTQSFTYTSEVSKGEWAEVTMGQLVSYEIAFNSAMQLSWNDAAQRLSSLITTQSKPAFVKYFYGCCMNMLDQTSDAILAYVEATKTIKGNGNEVEQFIRNRVALFEQSGYQDLELSLPAFEILLLWNGFASMADKDLEACLVLVDETLDKIYQREKHEHELRSLEVAPSIPPPDYYDQRATLLLIKVSICNALGKPREAIPHLNWVLDNRTRVKHSKWVVPYAYWEGGITCWCLQDFKRARSLWETSLSFSGYSLEYRLALQLNLAITYANDLGIEPSAVPKPEKGQSTQGRKRLSFFRKTSPTQSVDGSAPSV